MSITDLLQTATILLLLTALGGVAMAIRRISGKANPPDWLAMAHGFLAAAALTLILYAAFQGGLPPVGTAGAVVLLIGAAGGVVMNLYYHLAGKLIPQWLLHVHILLGVIGTTLIAWAAFGSPPAV